MNQDTSQAISSGKKEVEKNDLKEDKRRAFRGRHCLKGHDLTDQSC